MDTQVPRLPMDEMEGLFARVLSYTLYAVPNPPVSADVRLSALLPEDDVDRVSLLPDKILRNIVSRLPVTNAARTAELSSRWHAVWRSVPLVLVDSHLREVVSAADPRAESQRVTAAVSKILDAHPGPFRCIHLTSSYMEQFHGLLAGWIETLAVKDIQELVLVNRPRPLDLVLPASLFRLTTLTSLYLGLWKFPDTAGLPRSIFFPSLRELGLCSVIMENCDLNFLLDTSPALEILCVKGNMNSTRLRLDTRSLRCVQISVSFFEEINVVAAPRLERLIVSGVCAHDGVRPKINIGHAPKLHLLGYLDTENHVLEVRNNTIKAGTMVSQKTTVPSVKILSLEVHFGVRTDAKMIPSVLSCFPNVERLHIMSVKTDRPTGKLNRAFWHELGSTQCVRSSVELLVFRDFRGDEEELAFLKSFFESALMLKVAVIVLANGTYKSMEEVHSKAKILGSVKQSSKDFSMIITDCADADGGNIWHFKRGSDFSLGDPFANY